MNATREPGDDGRGERGGAIELVCFDLGGVLVRHCRTWREGCAAAGLAYRPETDTPELMAKRKPLAAALTAGKIEPGAFYERIAETCLGLYTAEEIRRIHGAWLGSEYAGVRPVVERLVRAGRVKTGVLSNTNGPHWERLERDPELATARLLSNRHASHVMGYAKPQAEIYAAFERVVDVPGERILFLEDLPENAAAARARGWHVALIDWTKETAPQIEAVLAGRELL
jgi:glucose-1-phosphatase